MQIDMLVLELDIILRGTNPPYSTKAPTHLRHTNGECSFVSYTLTQKDIHFVKINFAVANQISASTHKMVGKISENLNCIAFVETSIMQ